MHLQDNLKLKRVSGSKGEKCFCVIKDLLMFRPFLKCNYKDGLWSYSRVVRTLRDVYLEGVERYQLIWKFVAKH